MYFSDLQNVKVNQINLVSVNSVVGVSENGVTLFDDNNYSNYYYMVDETTCVLIGYPSRQDGPILPTQDYPLYSHKSKIL